MLDVKFRLTLSAIIQYAQSGPSLCHSSPGVGWSDRAVPPIDSDLALGLVLAHVHAHAVAIAGHDHLQNVREAVSATELGREGARAEAS